MARTMHNVPYIDNAPCSARAYAIGLGAGTQLLTLAVGEIIAGPPSELGRAFLIGAAWVINLAVAEWTTRKPSARVPVERATRVPSGQRQPAAAAVSHRQ